MHRPVRPAFSGSTPRRARWQELYKISRSNHSPCMQGGTHRLSTSLARQHALAYSLRRARHVTTTRRELLGPRLGAVSFVHRFTSVFSHHVHLHACEAGHAADDCCDAGEKPRSHDTSHKSVGQDHGPRGGRVSTPASPTAATIFG